MHRRRALTSLPKRTLKKSLKRKYHLVVRRLRRRRSRLLRLTNRVRTPRTRLGTVAAWRKRRRDGRWDNVRPNHNFLNTYTSSIAGRRHRPLPGDHLMTHCRRCILRKGERHRRTLRCARRKAQLVWASWLPTRHAHRRRALNHWSRQFGDLNQLLAANLIRIGRTTNSAPGSLNDSTRARSAIVLLILPYISVCGNDAWTIEKHRKTSDGWIC